MNFNLPLVLVLATAITGGVWLIDALFFAKKRKLAEGNKLLTSG